MRPLISHLSDVPVIILGAGGHAKVVAEALIQSDQKILGFLTPDEEEGTPILGFNVLGGDHVLAKFPPDEVRLANGIGSLPRENLRGRLAVQMRDMGYGFAIIIHPSAIVARDVTLCDGAQIMAGAVIQPGTYIGRDSIINTGVLLDHDCYIDQNCHLAPGVVCSGGVRVGEGSHLGTGTSVIQKICIGRNSIIAAGSIIYKDIPSDVRFIQKCESEINIKGG